MAQLIPFRDINVHASPSHYSFASPSTPSAPTLVVERPTGDIRLHDGALLGTQRVSSIAGILGIVQLKLDKYIIVITKAQPMGRLKGHMVYKVIATEFLPLRERPLHDADEDAYSHLLKTLIRTGPMYFAYSVDLTSSFQRQAAAEPAAPMWRRADDRFFWNRFLHSDLINFRQGAAGPGLRHQSGRPQPGVDAFILPVIFGMLSITRTSVLGQPFTFALITRRSRFRGGTRYFTRGIDRDGHVANFNETEQVVVLNDDGGGGLGGFAGGGGGLPDGRTGGGDSREVQILSYVQTRGSVPVYWAEVNKLGYTPDLQVRGVETAVEPARRHFAEQVATYGENFLVNLVNQRGREDRVKRAYEDMVGRLVSAPDGGAGGGRAAGERLQLLEPGEQRTPLDRLHYVYFDFHNETKGLRWERAERLLDLLRPGLIQGGYFRGVDMPGGGAGGGAADERLEVRFRQTAVVRTNCMDCLDRTNVVQGMLARWTLARQLTDAGLLRAGQRPDDDPAFAALFRNVWADNADVVSRAYSGTGALKTDFTRTGVRSTAGALQDLRNSITRYVKNNFLDGPRQDAYDLFLGVHRPAAYAGGAAAFADRRPLAVQAVPYLLVASLFMVLVASLTRRLPDATVWPVRLFTIFWVLVGLWSWRFIYTYGMLYVRLLVLSLLVHSAWLIKRLQVNWPKLNTPRYAIDGYQEALGRAQHDAVAGPLVARHERGASTARLSQAEEGKKRIQ